LALDFGTGSGDFARMLSSQFEQILAMDISDRAYRVLSRFGINVSVSGVHPDAV
jgi:methylase of polypeptide subunit release factors